jgi:nicotinamidase-related amidase
MAGKFSLPRSPRVLLLVDFINPLRFPGADELATPAIAAAKATRRLKDRLVKNGVQVIYANDNYGQWRSDFRELYERCLADAGPAGELARLLEPGKKDLVMLKPRHSAFFATPLDLVLTQLQAKTLIVCGLATDMCVQLTAMDAAMRGYKLSVPRDCTAAEATKAKNDALLYMQRVLKADIRASAPSRR